MDTDSFIIHIKTKDFYDKDIADDKKKLFANQIIVKMIKDHFQEA